MDLSRFELVSANLVAFTPIHAEFNQQKILAAIVRSAAFERLPKLQALPDGNELPSELPRLIFSSNDERWKLVARPASVGASWDRKDGDENIDIVHVVESCIDSLSQFIDGTAAKVGRLGFMITRAARIEQPAQFLIDRFCKTETHDPSNQAAPFRRSRNFEVHNHKRYTLDGLDINSWVRCRTGNISSIGEPVITVQQDLNTLSEQIEERRFDVATSRAFFGSCLHEVDQILRKYFPD